MGWEDKAIQAIFFSDGSPQSDEAREILESAKIIYEEVEKLGETNGSLNGYKPPLVRAKEGEFEGVDRIKAFADYVKDRVEA